jgi:hypothetical protein
MLNGLLAFISFIIAGVTFYLYTQSSDNKLYIAAAIVFALIGIVLGAMFLSGRVNKTEDIHITE